MPSFGKEGSELRGVGAVSASDLWAVGDYVGNTLIEHWDGTSWSVVPSPNPGTVNNYLSGVAAVSANDVLAVGSSDSTSSQQTLVEQWNGTGWNVVSTPSPGILGNYLVGVTAASENDVWAVGGYTNNHVYSQTLTEHWNGTGWKVVPSPNPGTLSNQLQGVAAISTSDVWAVGYYDQNTLIEQYSS